MINRLPIVIAGPTCSGKSSYALALGKQIDGVIICADSRQVYQDMHIGTASPTPEDRAQVEHLGFNCRSPLEIYDAGRFVRDTLGFIADVISRNRAPIIVGGTGLYLRCLRFGIDDTFGKSVTIRDQLEKEAASEGLEVLHQRLAVADPAAAARIHPHDSVRIIRALEIMELNDRQAQQILTSHFSSDIKLAAQWQLLWPERAELHRRLAERVKAMFSDGLIKEAVELRKKLPPEHRLLKTMGYEEALRVADGELSEAQAGELVLIRQRQYAKRQYTWFKKETWWEIVDAP